jgi:hypothetical protein
MTNPTSNPQLDYVRRLKEALNLILAWTSDERSRKTASVALNDPMPDFSDFGRPIEVQPSETSPAQDESGWLIEISSLDGKPRWLMVSSIREWTNDANAAIRFAREADADAMIYFMGILGAKATGHTWCSPLEPARPLTGGVPIDQYVAELEKDPAMKARLDDVREKIRRNSAPGMTGVKATVNKCQAEGGNGCDCEPTQIQQCRVALQAPISPSGVYR